MTEKEFHETWKKMRGTFPTKEENDFVEALWIYSFGDTIDLPYIYDDEKKHHLVREKEDIENRYKFIPAESWMTFQITYDKDNTNIIGIDTDGLGSMISIGSVINGMTVSKIELKANDGAYIYFE